MKFKLLQETFKLDLSTHVDFYTVEGHKHSYFIYEIFHELFLP